MDGLAVFLDRDGVLNRPVIKEGKSFPPASPGEFEILPGVQEACRQLKQAGFVLIVATNQPDVARGSQSLETVESMHQILRSQLPLDDIRTCYHDDQDRCGCRKPQPGLLLEAAGQWHINLHQSFMVGDRWKDIEAGRRAGCRTVFIDWNYNERLLNPPDAKFSSLLEAAAWICRNRAAAEDAASSANGRKKSTKKMETHL